MASPIKSGERPTTTVPVTAVEELPVLSVRERSDLLDVLARAEADIAAGDFTDYDPKALKRRLIDIKRGAAKP